MQYISDARFEVRNDITLVPGEYSNIAVSLAHPSVRDSENVRWRLRKVGGSPAGRSEDCFMIDELGNCADTISLYIHGEISYSSRTVEALLQASSLLSLMA
jgi:hypothetical protein